MDTVKEYISSFSGETQQRLEELDTMIMSLAEGITTKISWDMPTYSLSGGGVITRFGAFKKHIGFYPGAEATKVYGERITALGFNYSKGTIQLPFSQPLPLELIKEITLFNMERADKGENALWEVGADKKKSNS